jgi:peroxisomal coenzyme A diphosphatase NUDT7
MKVEAITQIVDRLHYSNSLIPLGHEPVFSVLIPLVEKEGELFLLFEKRSGKVRQPGEICFPGGKKEEGDISMEYAAMRETEEEIGISSHLITPLGKLGTLITLQMILHCFVGFLRYEDLPPNNFNQDEVEELLLINIDELMNLEPKHYKIKIYADPIDSDDLGESKVVFPSKELNLPSRYHERWTMGYREIVSYEVGKETIWGITGQILESFIQNVLKR